VVSCAASCAPKPAEAPTPPAPPLHQGPLTDFVPAAGLRWLAVARLAELSHLPALAPSIELLFPHSRLDAFELSTGLNLRAVPTGLAAGFDLATLFAAETPFDNSLVQTRFEARLVSAKVESSHLHIHRVWGTIGLTPESLVRIDDRLVAASIGDPTPARIVELYALGRLGRSPPALAGSALATLPRDLESAPLRFYAPGPFSAEWSQGARGLLGAALALGIGVWPDGDALRVRTVISGRWSGEDAMPLTAAWDDLAHSPMGRLLGLDQPVVPPEVTVTPQHLTLDVRLALLPLVSGLRAAVVADVWEFLEPPRDAHGAPTPARRAP
jgi:hypothetical protein